MGSCGGMKGGGRREATPCFIICSFHRLTSTLDLSVSLKARFALADVLGGKIAALSVVHALASQLRDLALVDIWKETILLTVCLYVMLYHPSRKYAPLPNYNVYHKSRINAAFRPRLTIRSHLVEDIVHLLQDAVNTWK